ncbi:Histone chaperone asf1 [Geranomyces variabilis]|nr:Histone chaperone asf1 [Geranomyces variabilis]
MSMVNIVNVQVTNNPCTFFDPFAIEITFEVIEELQEDLEFKMVYVGSAESELHDQTLESVMVGPVPVGASKFMLEAPAPDASRIPTTDIVGVTVVLLMCLYRGREFVRVGYYVNNDYPDEATREHPPEVPDLTKLQRSILADKPRVTRFSIPWDTDETVKMEADAAAMRVQEAAGGGGQFAEGQESSMMDVAGENDENAMDANSNSGGYPSQQHQMNGGGADQQQQQQQQYHQQYSPSKQSLLHTGVKMEAAAV